MIPDPSGGEPPLDAYSRAVSAVARELTPRVAALRVRHRGGEGAGSAVVFTGDGFLLTNAHVVGRRRRRARPLRRRHRRPRSTSSAPTRCPTSPSCAPTARRRRPAGLGDADRAAGRPAGRRGRQPARPGRLGHRRRGQRARPVAAGPRRGDAARSSRTSSRPTPRSTPATPAARSPTRRGRVVGINTAVAGIGLGLAVPINATTRRIIDALDAPRPGPARLPRPGQRARPAAPALATGSGSATALRVVEVVPGSPAARAGLRAGDLSCRPAATRSPTRSRCSG